MSAERMMVVMRELHDWWVRLKPNVNTAVRGGIMTYKVTLKTFWQKSFRDSPHNPLSTQILLTATTKMKFFSSITLASSFAQALAFPLTSRQANAPYFVLTGDSTTAVDGGWGDGFLALLTGGADGVNLGESGATTRSFVAEGFWGQAIDAVEANRDAYDPIVTIQFGHNDQKAESGVTLEMFKTNLLGFIGDVQAAGGTPVSQHSSPHVLSTDRESDHHHLSHTPYLLRWRRC